MLIILECFGMFWNVCPPGVWSNAAPVPRFLGLWLPSLAKVPSLSCPISRFEPVTQSSPAFRAKPFHHAHIENAKHE
jgi:hypothetical protein